jgi:hypothetical protein
MARMLSSTMGPRSSGTAALGKKVLMVSGVAGLLEGTDVAAYQVDTLSGRACQSRRMSHPAERGNRKLLFSAGVDGADGADAPLLLQSTGRMGRRPPMLSGASSKGSDIARVC